MAFVCLFYAGAAAELIINALLLQAYHVQRFPCVVSSPSADYIIDLRSCLHFTKFVINDLIFIHQISHLIMELTTAQIELMQAELRSLREENAHLRKLIREMQEKEQFGQFQLIRSTIQPSKNKVDNQKVGCPHCTHCKRPPEKSRKQLVEEFQMWSHRLNNSFPMKKHLSDIHSSDDEKQEAMSEIAEQIPKVDLLIQQICLFGPNLQEMTTADRHQKVSHQLYYPDGDASLQDYGNYLYPDKVGFKVIRQKKKDIDIDKILFRKSFKQQDCSIFIFFQCNGDQELPKNKISREINPYKTRYCIGLQFSDYIYSKQPYKPNNKNDRSMSISLSEDKIEELHPQQDLIVEEKKQANIYGESCLFKSNFYLCVFTYFPFVDFFCQLLIRIIDQIKIKRMEKQSEKGKKYQELDITYFAQEINNIFKQITPFLNSFSIEQGQKLNLNFGTQCLNLSLESNCLLQTLLWDWAYRTLRIFDKETLYQIYCLVMLQQTLCIVCENTYLLTFTIHLLVSLLPRPFHYPYPIVSIVFEEQFLETPFTTMMGINKGTKWIDSNQPVFMEKMEGKVILNLNDDEVKIKSKRKYKLPKSEKLKKIFNSFYKKAQKFDSSSKKKDFISRQVCKGENELAIQLINDIQAFYRQELFVYMPNKEIIDSIKLSVGGENQTLLSTKLIKNVQQYIKQSRKGKQHDAMVNALMQKQIFYVYLTQKYDIT